MKIFWAFAIIILVVTLLSATYRVIPSIAGVNLTCINSNITKLANQSMNLSMMSEAYFKNLTSDNPQLAQLICQDVLNHTSR